VQAPYYTRVRLTERIRTLPAGVIVAAGWAIGLVYAFPGMMTMDSLDQLREGREAFYTDGHPPAMAAMWRIVDAIVAGPIGMLAIQTAAFVTGMYLILRRALVSPRRAAVATVAIYLFPPVLAPMAVVWKDCVMAGFFLLGTALLFEDRRWWRVAGLACLILATAVRYNALAATLPLIGLLFAWPSITGWRRYLLAFGAWFAVTASAFAIDAALTDAKMYVWQSSLAVLDITGTLANVDTPIPDDELRKTLAGTNILVDKDIHAAIRARYALCMQNGMDFEPLIAREGRLWDLPLSGVTPAPPAQRDAITRAFWDVVTDHPGAYLAHRWDTMRDVLGLTSRPVGAMVMTFRIQYPQYMERMKLSSGYSPLQDWLQKRAVWVAKKTPLFRPWIYVVISLVLLPFAWRERSVDVIALLLSGLALEASLFPLAPTPDYRYSHLLVVCTVMAVVMLTARRARERPA
jgi:hypothetical protein